MPPDKAGQIRKAADNLARASRLVVAGEMRVPIGVLILFAEPDQDDSEARGIEWREGNDGAYTDAIGRPLSTADAKRVARLGTHEFVDFLHQGVDAGSTIG